MDAPKTRIVSRWHLLLLAVIGILTALAWSGWFDSLSSSYIDQALVSAGIFYATARGINAVVSVLQGTELDVVMLTFTIGEVLDPVNDLIERFSGIMLIALGSLALQKILLGMVSHQVFNLLLTLLALATGVALAVRQTPLYQIMLRAFIVIAFLRFSLGLVVLANNWVDIYFFANEDSRRHVAMENFEGELRQISSMAGINGPPDELIKASVAQIASLEKARAAEQQSLGHRTSELKQAERDLLELMQERPLSSKWNPLSQDSPAIAEAAQRVAELEAEAESIALTVASIDKTLAKQREDLACMRKREAGEACSFMENITSRLSPAEIGLRINALQDRVSGFAESTIALLVSALLKAVLIPLLFFYVLLRLAGVSWSRLR